MVIFFKLRICLIQTLDLCPIPKFALKRFQIDFLIQLLTLFQFVSFLGQQAILDALRSFGIYHDINLNGLQGMIYWPFSSFVFHFCIFKIFLFLGNHSVLITFAARAITLWPVLSRRIV